MKKTLRIMAWALLAFAVGFQTGHTGAFGWNMRAQSDRERAFDKAGVVLTLTAMLGLFMTAEPKRCRHCGRNQ